METEERRNEVDCRDVEKEEASYEDEGLWVAGSYDPTGNSFMPTYGGFDGTSQEPKRSKEA